MADLSPCLEMAAKYSLRTSFLRMAECEGVGKFGWI